MTEGNHEPSNLQMEWLSSPADPHGLVYGCGQLTAGLAVRTSGLVTPMCLVLSNN